MASETKFRENALNTLNKERMVWKAPKVGFQDKNKVEYKGIDLSKSLIPGTHGKVSNFKEFTKLTEILTLPYI